MLRLWSKLTGEQFVQQLLLDLVHQAVEGKDLCQQYGAFTMFPIQRLLLLGKLLFKAPWLLLHVELKVLTEVAHAPVCQGFP